MRVEGTLIVKMYGDNVRRYTLLHKRNRTITASMIDYCCLRSEEVLMQKLQLENDNASKKFEKICCSFRTVGMLRGQL